MTSSTDDPLQGRLDAPAKAALRWALAMATTRRDPHPTVDAGDLLAGILLADLRGSPARELLDHYRIPVGAVLRRDRVQLPSPEVLLDTLESLPPTLVPPIEVFIVADLLDSLPAGSEDSLISLRELFGGLLRTRALPSSASNWPFSASTRTS